MSCCLFSFDALHGSIKPLALTPRLSSSDSILFCVMKHQDSARQIPDAPVCRWCQRSKRSLCGGMNKSKFSDDLAGTLSPQFLSRLSLRNIRTPSLGHTKRFFTFLVDRGYEPFVPEASSRAERSSARQGGIMLNQERYLASRFGIHTSAQFSERHTAWESLEMDEQSVTPLTPSSGIAYLTFALGSLTALVVMLAFGFSSKASVSSITKHGTLQRASIRRRNEPNFFVRVTATRRIRNGCSSVASRFLLRFHNQVYGQ
jgi:hypothetical protein